MQYPTLSRLRPPRSDHLCQTTTRSLEHGWAHPHNLVGLCTIRDASDHGVLCQQREDGTAGESEVSAFRILSTPLPGTPPTAHLGTPITPHLNTPRTILLSKSSIANPDTTSNANTTTMSIEYAREARAHHPPHMQQPTPQPHNYAFTEPPPVRPRQPFSSFAPSSRQECCPSAPTIHLHTTHRLLVMSHRLWRDAVQDHVDE